MAELPVKLSEGITPSAGLQNRACRFLAHGSSSRTAFVISTIPVRTITTASVYLVVTVTLHRHQIAIGVIAAVLIAVMHFQKRLWQEDEPTISTSTVLIPQQGCDPWRDPRIRAAPCRPVAPVPIKGARGAFHFAMPHDRHG